MPAPPTTPTPSVSPAEMQVLVSRAGLTLNPGQMADLVLAWRQMAGLLARLRQGRPLADDQAFVFRLPAPASLALRAPAKAPSPKPPGKPRRPVKKAAIAKTARRRR